MQELTTEEIYQKAKEIGESKGIRVIPFLFIDPINKEQIIGFIEEPSRITKLRVLDKASQVGPMTAAGELLDALILKDVSNPRIYSEKPEDDSVYIGCAMACFSQINLLVEQLKKNSTSPK